MTAGRDGPSTAEWLRRRRGRNLAILFALIAFVGLVYWISIVRIGAGIEAAVHERQQQEAEQPGSADDGALRLAVMPEYA